MMQSPRPLVRSVLLVAVLVLTGCAAPVPLPPPLDATHYAAITQQLQQRALTEPTFLGTQDGMVVATYELSDRDMRRLAIPLSKFAEQRLLAIREALLPYGYEDYRVNINGEKPGTGLTKRYGSARLLVGTLEWIPGVG